MATSCEDTGRGDTFHTAGTGVFMLGGGGLVLAFVEHPSSALSPLAESDGTRTADVAGFPLQQVREQMPPRLSGSPAIRGEGQAQCAHYAYLSVGSEVAPSTLRSGRGLERRLGASYLSAGSPEVGPT